MDVAAEPCALGQSTGFTLGRSQFGMQSLRFGLGRHERVDETLSFDAIAHEAVLAQREGE